MVISAPPKRSKALENATYDDWKRYAIDTAKKRAVAQYVDYDTFKNMVLVAHLKPIGEATERAGGSRPLRGQHCYVTRLGAAAWSGRPLCRKLHTA